MSFAFTPIWCDLTLRSTKFSPLPPPTPFPPLHPYFSRSYIRSHYPLPSPPLSVYFSSSEISPVQINIAQVLQCSLLYTASTILICLPFMPSKVGRLSQGAWSTKTRTVLEKWTGVVSFVGSPCQALQKWKDELPVCGFCAFHPVLQRWKAAVILWQESCVLWLHTSCFFSPFFHLFFKL